MFVKFIGTDNVHYTTFKGIADVPMVTILCHRDDAAGLERCLLGSMLPDEFHELSVAQSAAMRRQLPLRGVSTPGHGQGEGSAGDKFRVSGTQETVEGAGASGVLEGADCCRCCALRIKKRGRLKSRSLLICYRIEF